MVMTVTESTAHELQQILYMTALLSIGQFMVRLLWLNGLYTTCALAGGVTLYSILWPSEGVLPLTATNLGFRAASDVVGFLAGIVSFLVLLVLSRTTELVFTQEALLTLLTGGGLSFGHAFLTIGLTYSSNMSLFSFCRFLANSLQIPSTLFSNYFANNNNNNNAQAIPEAPAVAAVAQAAPRGRGRPRGRAPARAGRGR